MTHTHRQYYHGMYSYNESFQKD